MTLHYYWNKILWLLLFYILYPFILYGQGNFRIGLKGSFLQSYTKYAPGSEINGNFVKENTNHFSGGGIINFPIKDIDSSLILELGILKTVMPINYRLNRISPTYSSINTGFRIVPWEITAGVKFLSNRLTKNIYLKESLGISYAFPFSKPVSYGGICGIGYDSLNYRFLCLEFINETNRNNNIISYVEVGVECVTKKFGRIDVGISYHYGFFNTHNVDITYYINNVPYHAKIISKGDYAAIDIIYFFWNY